MTWHITGIGPLEHLSGTYNEGDLAAILTRAQEEAGDWYVFDQMIEGRSARTGLLSGSQLLAALDREN